MLGDQWATGPEPTNEHPEIVDLYSDEQCVQLSALPVLLLSITDRKP